MAGDLLSASWIIPSTESPSSSWLGTNPEPEVTSLRFGRTSMVTPSSVLQIALDTREETLLKQEPVLGDFDAADYTTQRVWAHAEDGTRVPDLAGAQTGLALPAPCLLYGYGAYEISIDPDVLPAPALPPRPRHGLRRGPRARWRRDGPGLVRGRTDGAQGQHLQRLHRLRRAPRGARASPRPDAVAGRGGSAGGLLVGAVANAAPELFAALVAQVPFVDVLTTMLDADLPLTVGEWEEWGNPLADKAAYDRMLSYSPYDNVSGHNPDGSPRTYPSLLVTAGLNDPRVSYWEPAKWVAKIRALSPSTRVLLRTEMGAGHGGPSGRYDAWKEEALVFAFLLDALGMLSVAACSASASGDELHGERRLKPGRQGDSAPVDHDAEHGGRADHDGDRA